MRFLWAHTYFVCDLVPRRYYFLQYAMKLAAGHCLHGMCYIFRKYYSNEIVMNVMSSVGRHLCLVKISLVLSFGTLYSK